jgi:hypothetical protein
VSAVAKNLFLTIRKILMQYNVKFTPENSMKFQRGVEGQVEVLWRLKLIQFWGPSLG